MSKIKWTVDTFEEIGKNRVYFVPDLPKGYNQGSGIRPNSKMALLLKTLLWPLLKLRQDLLVDGFIEREVGKWISKFITADSIVLDIGCGDMSLRKYVLRANRWYNALDLEISRFHLVRVCRGNHRVNLVVASATNIPAPSDSASIIVSTEAFEHIPEIDKAIQEIHRVAAPNAVLICSIPNNYCYKYDKKGKNRAHINEWTYKGFIEYMGSRSFRLIEGSMKGAWIPLPLWLTKTSYQLPLTPKLEYYNTNFFYVFQAIK